MSEPTDGGRQPDPDPDNHPDNRTSEGQHERDQASEPMFSDPTAPVWVDPTTAVPAPPTPPAPPGAAQPQDGPPPAPPQSNPYAQQPPVQQPPAQPYGQPYGQPQQSPPYPAYGQSPYVTGPPTETNTSAVVLAVLSGIVMLSTCFIIGIPSLILGIMALSSNRTDAEGSRKKAKTGWILFAANVGVVVLLALVGFGLLLANSPSGLDSDF